MMPNLPDIDEHNDGECNPNLAVRHAGTRLEPRPRFPYCSNDHGPIRRGQSGTAMPYLLHENSNNKGLLYREFLHNPWPALPQVMGGWSVQLHNSTAGYDEMPQENNNTLMNILWCIRNKPSLRGAMNANSYRDVDTPHDAHRKRTIHAAKQLDKNRGIPRASFTYATPFEWHHDN